MYLLTYLLKYISSVQYYVMSCYITVPLLLCDGRLYVSVKAIQRPLYCMTWSRLVPDKSVHAVVLVLSNQHILGRPHLLNSSTSPVIIVLSMLLNGCFTTYPK